MLSFSSTVMRRPGWNEIKKPSEFPIEKDATVRRSLSGLKLVANGSVAVFCGRKDTAAKICEDAAELFERTGEYDQPLDVSDTDEVERIATLFAREFGEATPAARSAALGIFPHHASVPHGLRLSIEYAMKVSLVRFVVCTSTLAQGVNLPIKYLIVTSEIRAAASLYAIFTTSSGAPAGRACIPKAS